MVRIHMDEEQRKTEAKGEPVPGTITAADVAATKPETQQQQALPKTTLPLLRTLIVINKMQSEGIISRYAIGGAVGATFYLEPVSTMDVDVFVSHMPQTGMLLTTSPLYDYLGRKGYHPVGEGVKIEDWLVQFLPPTGKLAEEGIAQANEFNVEGVQVYVFSAEHLVAIALQTGRPKDMARILQFIDADVLDEKKLDDILDRHGLSTKWSSFKQRFTEPL